MSTVAKQLQHSFHGTHRQVKTTLDHNYQQLHRKISIDSSAEKQEKGVTNKTIKSRQFSKQKSVAAKIAEEKRERENKKDTKSQSQDIERKIVKEFEETYLNEQENRETKDYQIYQNGKVNEFFQNESVVHPQKVADVCLINDHYILVKMPEPETSTANYNNLASDASRRRKQFRTQGEHNDTISEDTEKNNKKLCRYLRSKRNRVTKIAPIHEEPEDLLSDDENKTAKTQSKLYCLNLQSCWQANELEVETYQTRTKIHKNISGSACDQRKSLQASTVVEMTASKPAQSLDTQKPPIIQTISGSLLKTSIPCQVSLHQYGALIESNNNNNNRKNTMDQITKPQHKKRPRLESFYCLLRPFRAKYRKAKPKIQAVVYKTYFVKWTKPPDKLNHGYGLQSLKSSNAEMSVLRRCRSATF